MEEKPKLFEIDRPLDINPIRCRLKQDCELFNQLTNQQYVPVPINELELILDIVDAACDYREQHEPTEWEAHAHEAGTLNKKELAHKTLIEKVKKRILY